MAVSVQLRGLIGVPRSLRGWTAIRNAARSFVLAALRALHLAPLRLAVGISYYRGPARRKVSHAFMGLVHVADRSPVVATAR